MKKYLSKSLFKNALDCRTKLYYATNSEKYKDNRIEDPFLNAIAEGGFQVGELAKCYYPEGVEIDSSLSYEDNFEETKKLLKQKNVVIFEGVLLYEKYMARFDILVKKGNNIRLIEVKSKSYNGGDFSEFLNKKNGSIKSEWIDNMYDVTYQRWILSKVYPDLEVETCLMLADKSKCVTVDNLNQKFILTKDEKGNTKVIVNGDVRKKSLGEPILTEVNVDDVVNIIENHEYTEGRTFEEWLRLLMESFIKNEKLVTNIGKKCDTCQFTCTSEEEAAGFKNGKKECWINNKLVGEKNYGKPTVLDVWDYRTKDKKISEGVIFMEQLKPSDFLNGFDTYKQVGEYFSKLNRNLESKERQLLQVYKTNTKDDSIYVNIDALKNEMNSWVFPLHFIDFETTSVAIPFHKGLKPYEGVAFQFSHHIMKEDGTVEHAGEYINTEVGHFPNFDFVRELKRQLENDNGTIFRYSPHENSYLNTIFIQMWDVDKTLLPDKDELLEFIKTITHKSSSAAYNKIDVEDWVGERNMVDLWDILKKYYYNPYTEGSNSIKDVLPSILKSSEFLKNKYSQPIYGTDEIKSLNFKNHTWLKIDGNNVINPYKQLPYVFEGIDSSIIDTFVTADSISDGGAAMTAYAKIQFSDMSEVERTNTIKALLRYCELDTLAMVMLYEHWAELVYGKTYTKKDIKIEEKVVEEVPENQHFDYNEIITDDNDDMVTVDEENTITEIDVLMSTSDFNTEVNQNNLPKSEMNNTYQETNINFNKENFIEVNGKVVGMKGESEIKNENKKNTTFSQKLDINSSNNNKLKTKKSMKKVATKKNVTTKKSVTTKQNMVGVSKTIQTERWIKRFKKNSTNQLFKMIDSNHYNDHQKFIMAEILQARSVTPLYVETVVKSFKKESSAKIKKMIKSKTYTDFDRNVMKEILQVRKVKI
jgi:hypothetical protein